MVRRLESLGPDELRAVHRHEASHRNRRTILNRTNQLLGEGRQQPDRPPAAGVRVFPAAGAGFMEAVRPAQPEDRSVCHALLSQALTDVVTQRGGAVLAGPITADELLDAWLAPGPLGDPVAVFVGQFHDVVVGLLAVTAFTRTGAAAASGRVECCYVEEGARGVGVGSAPQR